MISPFHGKRTNVISLAAGQCHPIFLRAAAIAIQFSHPYFFPQILVQLFKKENWNAFLVVQLTNFMPLFTKNNFKWTFSNSKMQMCTLSCMCRAQRLNTKGWSWTAKPYTTGEEAVFLHDSSWRCMYLNQDRKGALVWCGHAEWTHEQHLKNVHFCIFAPKWYFSRKISRRY